MRKKIHSLEILNKKLGIKLAKNPFTQEKLVE